MTEPKEPPYLKTCRFCDNTRSSTGDIREDGPQTYDRLRLVCKDHWDQLWEEYRPAAVKRKPTPAQSYRHHRACWSDRIFEVVVLGQGSYLYTGPRKRDAARKRIEKALAANKQVLLFYADVIWEEGMPDDQPNELEPARDELPEAARAIASHE